MKNILSYLFAVLLLVSAVAHIVNPDFYARLIPSFIPALFANLLSTIVEAPIAILLIIPKYRKIGALAFMGLMIAFLPLHIWDLFKEDPITITRTGGIIRLVLQFLLIYAGWWLSRDKK
jgi:uncharacterized membrane protein